MNTKYIYSGSRAKALETRLLSDVQVERLLSSKELPETFKALQDTFLAPYMAEHEKTDVNKALDQSMLETKNILASISPEPELLNILWIKYDFYNLKAIMKGKKAGFNNEEIVEKCSHASVYTPEKLIQAYDEKKLHLLNKHFNDATEEAESAKEVFEIDIAMNIHYFKAIKDIASTHKNNFVNEYVSLLVDFFNLESSLRLLSLNKMGVKNIFITGGTVYKKDLEGQKNILEQYKKLGGEKVWDEAIKEFEKTGDFSLLERTADEYTLSYLKEKSADIMSPAPLFAYFSAKKNNAQTIRAVMVAKQAGLPERDLRIILRRLYA